jgi:hypothetical protein
MVLSELQVINLLLFFLFVSLNDFLFFVLKFCELIDGVSTSAINLVGVILPVFFGAFMDHTGEVTVSCIFLMMMAFIGLVCSWLLLRSDRMNGSILSSVVTENTISQKAQNKSFSPNSRLSISKSIVL